MSEFNRKTTESFPLSTVAKSVVTALLGAGLMMHGGVVVAADITTDVDYGNHKITNLGTGADANDAATVGQVNAAKSTVSAPTKPDGTNGNIIVTAGTPGTDGTNYTVSLNDDIEVDTIKTTGDATVGGKLSATGNVETGANVVAGGNVKGGTLESTGDATVGGKLSVTGNVDAAGNVTAKGALSAAEGKFTVAKDGATTINSNGSSFVVDANGVGASKDDSTLAVTKDGVGASKGASKLAVTEGGVGITKGDSTAFVVADGAIAAKTGDTSFEMSEDGLDVNGKFQADKDGNIHAAGKATIDGNLSAAEGKFNVTEGGAVSAADGKFTVDADGTTKVSSNGSNFIVGADGIGASKGDSSLAVTEGGVGLVKGDNSFVVGENAIAGKVGETGFTMSENGLDVNGKFQADKDGAISAAGGKFAVDKDGNITGQGNMTIVNPDGSALAVDSNGITAVKGSNALSVGEDAITAVAGTTGFKMSEDGLDVNGKFQADKDGNIHAAGKATIDGNLSAAEGKFNVTEGGAVSAADGKFTVANDGTTVVNVDQTRFEVNNLGADLKGNLSVRSADASLDVNPDEVSFAKGSASIKAANDQIEMKAGTSARAVLSDAEVSMMNAHGNGIVATEFGTTVTGGSTSLQLNNDGAKFSGVDGAPVRVTGVADGTSAYDAVNYNQLQQLYRHVNNVEKKSSRGIAGVAAMANIPQVEPGKVFSVGVGIGSYGGYQALAIGASGRVTENTVVKGSLARSGSGQTVLGAGISHSW